MQRTTSHPVPSTCTSFIRPGWAPTSRLFLAVLLIESFDKWLLPPIRANWATFLFILSFTIPLIAGADPGGRRSKVWFCYRSLAGIGGSNPTGGMALCLLWVLCLVQVEVPATGGSLVRRSPTERGASECDLVTSKMRRPTPSNHGWKNYKNLKYLVRSTKYKTAFQLALSTCIISKCSYFVFHSKQSMGLQAKRVGVLTTHTTESSCKVFWIRDSAQNHYFIWQLSFALSCRQCPPTRMSTRAITARKIPSLSQTMKNQKNQYKIYIDASILQKLFLYGFICDFTGSSQRLILQ
jgi:hypothetical protein